MTDEADYREVRERVRIRQPGEPGICLDCRPIWVEEFLEHVAPTERHVEYKRAVELCPRHRGF